MGFQFKFFTPVVELRLENDPWIVKMEYYSLKYLTVHIKCFCVMSMFELDSGALAILLS